MKTGIAYLLTIAFILSCIPVAVFAATTATNTATYTVSNVTAQAGEQVRVPVKLVSDIDGGFCLSDFAVEYETDYLELVDLNLGADALFAKGHGIFDEHEAEFGSCLVTPFNVNGEAFVLIFNVADNIPSGEYSISLVESADGYPWFADETEKSLGITPTVNPGSITVTGGGKEDDDGGSTGGGITTYKVGDATATPGETIEVPVSLDNQIEGGIAVAIFEVEYDSTVLELQGVHIGSSFSEDNWFSISLSGNLVECFADWNDSTSGQFVVLKFKVAANASSGSYRITLQKHATDNWFENWEGEYGDVVPNVEPGTITVTDGSSGGNTTTAIGGCIPASSADSYDVWWSYGGTVEKSGSSYYITPDSGYVIEEIWVDGEVDYQNSSVGPERGSITYTPLYAPTRSIIITFAYTVNFKDPLNGSLTVKRGGETLTSGSIVHAGEVLEISAAPGFSIDAEGFEELGGGLYRVIAKRNAPPSIEASKSESVSDPVPKPADSLSAGGFTCTVNGSAQYDIMWGYGGTVYTDATTNSSQQAGYIIAPAKGFVVDTVRVDGGIVTVSGPTASGEYVYRGAVPDNSLTATFVYNGVEAGASGTVASTSGSVAVGSGGGTVTLDGSGRYTVTPAEGYVIDQILADGRLVFTNYESGERDPLTRGSYAYSPDRSLLVTFVHTLEIIPPEEGGTVSVRAYWLDGLYPHTVIGGEIMRPSDTLYFTAEPETGYDLSWTTSGVEEKSTETPVHFVVTGSAPPSLAFRFTNADKDMLQVEASDFASLKQAVENAAAGIQVSLTQDITVDPGWRIDHPQNKVVIQGNGHSLTIQGSNANGYGLTIGDSTTVVLKDLTIKADWTGKAAVGLGSNAVLDLYSVAAASTSATSIIFENIADGAEMNIYGLVAENLPSGVRSMNMSSTVNFWPMGTIRVESFDVLERTGSDTYPVGVIKKMQDGYRMVTGTLTSGTFFEDMLAGLLLTKEYEITKNTSDYPYTLILDAVLIPQDEYVTLEVGSIEGVQAGDTIEVPVYLDTNIAGGFSSVRFWLQNVQYLSLIGVEIGEDFLDIRADASLTGSNSVEWTSNVFNVDNPLILPGSKGKFLTLIYQVGASAPNGTYDLKLDSAYFYNRSSTRWLDVRNPNYIPGKVTIGDGFEVGNETGQYTMTPVADNGAITLSTAGTVVAGDTVTVTSVVPSDGRYLSSLSAMYAVQTGDGYEVKTEDITKTRSFTVPDEAYSTEIKIYANFKTPADMGITFIDAGGQTLYPGTDGNIHVYPGAPVYVKVGGYTTATLETISKSGTTTKTLDLAENGKIDGNSPVYTVTEQADVIVGYVRPETILTTAKTETAIIRIVPDSAVDTGKLWNITVQTVTPDGEEGPENSNGYVTSSAYSSTALKVTEIGAGATVNLPRQIAPTGWSYVETKVTYVMDGQEVEETFTTPGVFNSTMPFTMPAADVTVSFIYKLIAVHPVYTIQPEVPGVTLYVRKSLDKDLFTWSEWTTSDDGQGLEVFVGPSMYSGQWLQVQIEGLPEDYIVDHVTYTYGSLDDPAGIVENVSGPVRYVQLVEDGPVYVSVELSKTIDNVVYVSTLEDLEEIGRNVANGITYQGKLVQLTNDIVLTGNWTPIGNHYYNGHEGGPIENYLPFMGTFDGAGYTISGLNIYYDEVYLDREFADYEYPPTGLRSLGLFGYTTDAVIKNLTVEGDITIAAVDPNHLLEIDVGSIVGYAKRTSLINCTSIVDVTSTPVEAVVGGLVGYIGGEYEGAVISNCLNYGDLKNCIFLAGGIAGYALELAVTECANYGDITGESGTELGGLFGSISTGVFGRSSIERSVNKGNIISRMSYGGGLVGNANNFADGAVLVITDSYNTGEITHLGGWPSGGSLMTLGGLVGSNDYGRYDLELNNCYSKATNTSLQTVMFSWEDFVANNSNGYTNSSKFGGGTTTINNCYSPEGVKYSSAYGGGGYNLSDYSGEALAAALGDSFVYNPKTQMVELAWESKIVSTGTYHLTFELTPRDAAVELFTSADYKSNPVTGWTNGGELPAGTYYYRISAENYITVEGEITLAVRDVTRTVSLTPKTTVTFLVNPEDSDMRIHHVDNAALETFSSKTSASILEEIENEIQTVTYTQYTFELAPGERYEYSVSHEEYISEVDILTVPGLDEKNEPIKIKLAPVVGDKVTGGSIITEKGTYSIISGSTGIIYIDTSDPVTLVGTGISDADCYEDLTIQYRVSGAHLTIKDLFINNSKDDTPAGSVVKAGTYILTFMGGNNHLNFEGTNLLELQEYVQCAAIHVGPGTTLTIGDVSSGRLYLFKSSQGSGIGGNTGEACGTIEFAGGNIFMKGTKTGALVGGDATNGAKNGTITISGGILNLITSAQGAAIGSSRQGTCAGVVRVTGGVTTIIADYRGSAIGYGGDYYGTSGGVGGTLSVTGGSLKCVATNNFLSGSGSVDPQVVDVSVITANMGNLALLTFDAKNGSVTVDNGYGTVFAGHRYEYADVGASTIGSWRSASDSNVYLFLDKSKTYTLARSDGQKFSAKWDEAKQEFVVEEIKAAALATTEIIDGLAITTIDSGALVETLKGLSAGTTLEITADIPRGTSIYGSKMVMTRTDVQNMANAGVLLKTISPIAEITLTNAGLKDIASRPGNEVVISAITEKDGIHIGVSIDGKEIDKINGGLTVTVPIPDPSLDVMLVMVNADGSETIVKDAVIGRTTITAVVDGSCILKIVEKPTAVLKTSTVIQNGIAITTVDSEALEQTLKTVDPNTQLVITPDIPNNANIRGTTAVMTREDVRKMSDAGVSLKVESPIADITLSNTALGSIAGHPGDEVTISAIQEDDGIHIEVALDGVALRKITDGLRVTISLDKKSTANTKLVLVAADGTETVIEDAVVGAYSITAVVDGSCVLKVVERLKELVLQVTTVIENGKATTTIDSASLLEILKEADSGTQIVIDADIPEGVEIHEAVTLLTRGDVRAIAESEASLKIGSPLADIVLSNTALKSIAGATTEDDSDEIAFDAALTENGTYIGVLVNGKAMSKVEGGLLVRLPAANPTPGTVMVLVDEYGNETVIKKSVAGTNAVSALLDGSCTVKVLDNAKSFSDVITTAWYNDAVEFATGHELFNGISETQFDPTGLMTRSMLVTVLHRLEDTPTAAQASQFGDVVANSWYTDAVDWASANRIVEGTGSGFNPDGSVTREQIATILYRYMQHLELDVSDLGIIDTYSDGGQTSSWAYDAIQWAVGAGIIQGKSTTVLDPGGNASRAEVATMLQRLINLMVD